MILKISSQFASDFRAVNDVSLHEKVKDVLEIIKNAKTIANVSHFKKIKGNREAYKMGIGFYYIVGITNSETELVLMRFLHRDMVTKILNKT
ncbi:hypothetical protein U6A24_16840 [Aquimarina gracilis]|uniref:ParE-like toxin of type II ParDE toxin-antitoxin system n=1 Tax=Aquimarina gracilis TaxID=874422 RepID=A0ABU5ZZ28_9FLAO|nr:hypothetical protein [Aquimarina gracilis]MEB3347143.1 hypothetical protein [Aquimarina gracilis]